MKPVFARMGDGIVIVDGHARVVVSETRNGRVYLHVTRGRAHAPGLRPDDLVGAGRVVALYVASSGKSGPESPAHALQWAPLAVRAKFRLSYTGEWEFAPGEYHEFVVPPDAIVDWYPGVLPEAPANYIPFAWYSPDTRTNVLYYMPNTALYAPPAHVVVRAMWDPSQLWDRVRADVEAFFKVERVWLESRFGPIEEIYRFYRPELEKRGRVVRVGCTTARVVPVRGWRIYEALRLLDRWGSEYYGVRYITARGMVLARRRGVYVGDLIDQED